MVSLKCLSGIGHGRCSDPSDSHSPAKEAFNLLKGLVGHSWWFCLGEGSSSRQAMVERVLAQNEFGKRIRRLRSTPAENVVQG